MKKPILLISILFSSIFIFSQNSVDDYIKSGIIHHDNGNYKAAITSYKKALKLDPKSTLIHYEISFSYFSKGDYKEAIRYSDFVLKQKEKHMLQAYITKGSALDMLGKTKKSIKLFEKALKQKEKHFLLYYNLALNYYKINNLEKAEENLIKGIEANPNHASSHLLLANIHNRKNNRVQTLLATHYFLFLEPNSQRSKEAYQLLQNRFVGNVSKDNTKPNKINITLSDKDDDFSAVELMISLLEASKNLEENDGKTKDEMFIENTDSFFTILGELKDEENKEIWWTFYTTFFYDLAQSEHIETYCKYISQSQNENSKQWLTENDTKLKEFDTWLQGE
jgi:tetratricopeptide (TPR) repeat protein